MAVSDLNPAQRFAYEWQYGRLGGFSDHLAETIARADDGNRLRLALGFPDEVAGITAYQQVEGWWEEVLRVASGSDSPTP